LLEIDFDPFITNIGIINSMVSFPRIYLISGIQRPKLTRGNKDEDMRKGSRMESNLASKKGNLHFPASTMDSSLVLLQKF
jgi:hypothetical protein